MNRIHMQKPLARLFPVFLAAACALTLPAQDEVTETPPSDGPIVLRNATVLTGTGQTITGAAVVIVDGKITAVGKADEVVLPTRANVIDCEGGVITPGLVDAGTTIGLDRNDQNEQGFEVTPHLRVADAINPESKSFVRARRNGVTTVQINPGNNNVIGGLGAVVKTAGDTVAEMLVTQESGLRITMGGQPSRGNRAIRGGTPASIYYRRPTTRMGVVWETRKAFFDAQEYMEQKTVPGEAESQGIDPGLEILTRVLNGEITVRTTARQEQDIRTALRLAKEFGYKTLVEEATEAWRVIDELVETETTVLLSAPSRDTASEGAEVRWHTLTLLEERGVPFAICSGADVGNLNLMTEATFAVRFGLSREAALAAITSRPAEILGLSDRVGSIAAGKDADLIVWSADPFEPTSSVRNVYVGGEEVTR